MMLDANRRRTAAMASNEPRNRLDRAPAEIRTPSGLTATAEVVALETSWSRVIASASLVRTSRLARVGRSPDGPASRLVAPITVVKLAERATPWLAATLVATHIDVAAAAVVSMVAVFSRVVTTSFSSAAGGFAVAIAASLEVE